MIQHLAPETTPCPDCSSTGKRCKRPSGHDAQNWHNSRENAYALKHPDCTACNDWLRAGHK